MTIEGLIPNSQVVVVPYQPEDVDDPSTWNKQLFLQPGWWIFWVGVALVTSFVGLAIVVLVLSLNEKVGRAGPAYKQILTFYHRDKMSLNGSMLCISSTSMVSFVSPSQFCCRADF